MRRDIQHIPTPVAAPLMRADQVADSDPYLSLTWEYVAFTNLIRILALSALMDYVESSGGGDPTVEETVKTCQRPSTGSWIRLLHNLVRWAETGKQSLFLSDLPASVSRLTARRMLVPGELVDGEPGTARHLPIIDVILQQRNQLAIAHGSSGLSRESLQQVLQLVTDAQRQVLQSVNFLDKIKLAAVINWKRFGFSPVQELVGPEPTPGYLDLSALTDNPGFLIVRQTDGLMQRLFPLFIFQVAASPARPATDDCALLYDGLSGRRVIYRGVHRRQFSRANFSRIQELLSRKSADIRLFRADSLDWQTVHSFSALNAQTLLDARQQNGLFSPTLYIERSEVGSSMEAFLSSELPAIILSGGAGMGKTSLLLAELQRSVASSIETTRTEFYLDVAESVPSELEIDLDVVFEQHLRLAIPMREALELLNRQRASANGERVLILFLDGIERHAHPARLLESVVRFVETHRDIACLKVIIAIRDIVLDVLEKQVKIPLQLFYTERSQSPDSKDEWRPRLTIGVFSPDELQRALQRYDPTLLNTPGVAGMAAGSLVEILRHPLFLSLYLAQHGQDYGPDGPQPLDLIRSYISERVSQSRASEDKEILLAALADQLLKEERTTVPIEHLAVSYPTVSRLVDAAGPNAPYVQLQSDRILIEFVVVGADGHPEIRLGFTWDVLFDYFVAWRTAQQDRDQVDGLLKLSEKAKTFFPLIGSLTLRFADLVSAAQEHEAAKVAAKMAPEILTQILVRLVSDTLHATRQGLGDALIRVLKIMSQRWSVFPRLVAKEAAPWVQLAMELSLRNSTHLLEQLIGEIGRHAASLSALLAYELANAQRLVASYHGERDEELKTIELMIDLARRARRRDLMASTHKFEAMNCVRGGRYAAATAAARRAVREFRRAKDSRGEGDAWTYVATAQMFSGDASGARRSVQRAQQLALSLNDPEIAANTAFSYGLLCHHVEAAPQSIHAHESAIAIYATRGDRLSEGIELVNLADAYWSSGLLDEAVTLGEKILKLAPSLGAEVDDVARICHANTLASLGDWRRAEALYEQGIQIARRIDNRWDVAYGLLYYALLWFDERHEWRADGFAEAIRVSEEINSSYLNSLGIALDLLCRIESFSGCDRDATLRLDLAEKIAGRTGAVGGQFYATVARCLLLRSLGERRGAAVAARRVLRLHASHPYIRWRPELGVLVATRTLRWAASRSAPDSALGRACSQLLAKAYTIGETQRRQRYLREPWINRDLLALGIQRAVAF